MEDDPGTGSNVIFDSAANIYQNRRISEAPTTWVLFAELTPSGGSWTEGVTYSFTGGSNGTGPFSGLIFDQVGNCLRNCLLTNEQRHGLPD